MENKIVETIHDILKVFNLGYGYRIEEQWKVNCWIVYLTFYIKGEKKVFCMQLDKNYLVADVENDYKERLYNNVRHSIIDLLS